MNPPLLPIDLLQYATHQKLRLVDEKQMIWDPCRKKFVQLAPEELVRQCLVSYLLDAGIGIGRMITERGLINYQSNRFDLGVRSQTGKWSLLAECKSFKTKMSDEVVLQAAKYNQTMKATFTLITNGKTTFAWITGQSPEWLSEETHLLSRI